MATMKEIKRRRDSIQSTEQITKAMKLVSRVKLQKSRRTAETARPYSQAMYEMMAAILSRTPDTENPFLKPAALDKKAVVAISSNRGLAGGYNNNIVRMIAERIPKESALIYCVGRKGKEGLLHRGYQVCREYSEVIEAPLYSDAVSIAGDVMKAFDRGKAGEIYLAYTSFKNTVTHIPKLLKLLPVEGMEGGLEEGECPAPMNYDMGEEETLRMLVPKYVASMIYGGMLEAAASENGARMQAMDSATSNAEKMIEELSLQYNRARQSSITQELTEIIGGAEAMG